MAEWSGLVMGMSTACVHRTRWGASEWGSIGTGGSAPSFDVSVPAQSLGLTGTYRRGGQRNWMPSARFPVGETEGHPSGARPVRRYPAPAQMRKKSPRSDMNS